MKRIYAILSLTAASLLLLQGCGTGTAQETAESGTTLPETTAEEVIPQTADIIADGKSDYSIVRGDDCAEVIIKDASALMKRLKRVTGVTVDYTTDWVKPGTDTSELKEILVGETTREESVSFIEALPEGGYGYAVIGSKLVISGKTPDLTAMALTLFENKVIYEKEYTGEGYLKLPADLELVMSSKTEVSQDVILNSSENIAAYTEDVVKVGQYQGFTAAQGAATDGKYFYCILKKKSGDNETDVIVKINRSDLNDRTYSEELPLDHANDMCYNSAEKLLVLPNLVSKKISYVDPETLKFVKTVEATSLPGTPWAIAYHASDGYYTVLAGAYVNICDSNFTVKRQLPYHSESTYVGQGMDCDENFIYVPLSPSSSLGTKDNIIVVYSYTEGFKRVVHLELGIESETMMNYNGEYWIVFNNGGIAIKKIFYSRVYT